MRAGEFSKLFNGRKSEAFELLNSMYKKNTFEENNSPDAYYKQGNLTEFENVVETLKNY